MAKRSLARVVDEAGAFPLLSNSQSLTIFVCRLFARLACHKNTLVIRPSSVTYRARTAAHARFCSESTSL